VSKERAARRAQREAEQAATAATRARRAARRRRTASLRTAVAAPFVRLGHRVRRAGASLGRRTRGQRIVLMGAVVFVLTGLSLASTWGLRFVIVGLTALLLPVAWTLVSGRR
jgi:hypothetical protein